METLSKVLIALCIVLAILVIVSNLEVRTLEKKDRTEAFIQSCEFWKVCDYRLSPYCASTICEKTYQCWIEYRNCEAGGKLDEEMS